MKTLHTLEEFFQDYPVTTILTFAAILILAQDKKAMRQFADALQALKNQAAQAAAIEQPGQVSGQPQSSKSPFSAISRPTRYPGIKSRIQSLARRFRGLLAAFAR